MEIASFTYQSHSIIVVRMVLICQMDIVHIFQMSLGQPDQASLLTPHRTIKYKYHLKKERFRCERYKGIYKYLITSEPTQHIKMHLLNNYYSYNYIISEFFLILIIFA